MDPPSQISVDAELWNLAEQRAHEIICCVQPNRAADEKRKEILGFLQYLIGDICGSEFFPFGSLPLRVYLPDGDVDITALIHKSREEDLAKKLVSLLETPDYSGISVCDVQYIRAKVDIVKCSINNIAVDISFNQLAGLSTLCFLEKVDQLIGKNHLFKRSAIFIKAWCYYESRILGAHYGLMSTYGLEVLVLYIINLFHSTLHGPLAVLHRFLDYYSKFDWENYAVSINGPVPKSLLPGTSVPEKTGADGDQLLLSEEFLQTCRQKFTVSTGAPDTGTKVFPIKFLNVVDPLKHYNNLGRCVSQGSFYRIRSALSLGLRQLKEVFLHPGESIGQRLENFFLYTLERNGRGQRPDVEVPVSAFGTGKFEVCDLSGDYERYYGWLLYSQQYHESTDFLSQPSTPPSPFLVRDGIVTATPFQPLQQYQNPLYFQGTDDFVPRVPVSYRNSPILPGPAGFSEEMQNLQESGPSVLGMAPLAYRDLHLCHPSNDARYRKEMQHPRRMQSYIPGMTQLHYGETHSSIYHHPYNCGYPEDMQKSRGTGAYFSGMTQLPYRETHSSINHHPYDDRNSGEVDKSKGTGTYIPGMTQLPYRGTHSSVDYPLNEAQHPLKAAHISPRNAYIQMRSGTQSSCKEKHPSTHRSEREMYLTSTERNLTVVNRSKTQRSQEGSGETKVLLESEKKTVDLSLTEFPLLHGVLKTSSEANQSSLHDVHQSKKFSNHLSTIESGSARHALSSELPFLLKDQLAISSKSPAVDRLDPSRSGLSRKTCSKKKQKKRERLKPKAETFNF